MKLHMRGVEIVAELLDAADHAEQMAPAESPALRCRTWWMTVPGMAEGTPRGEQRSFANGR